LQRRFFPIFALALASLLAAGTAHTQSTSFGKNKVQYRTFDWHYLQTTHFDVYFDLGDEQLAEFTADAAESAYALVSQDFRYRITDRIPFVVYNSHNEFQQTNVISEYLDEGIGGVTELFKNRVVVPFEGDYGKFRHVIHHELVHAVINEMFYGGSIQSIISNNITLQLPLWFNEGLAEYEALGWDTNSDMFMRDATMHTYLPPIGQLGGYFAYRGGQSVWNYIARKYGRDKVGDILNRIRGARSVDAGFMGALGMNVEELSEKWTKEQKVLYWPDIAKRADPSDYALPLTDHRKEDAFYNTSPAISPSGDRIAFISDRSEYFSVYLMSSEDGTIIRKLVTGQQTADFEELHLITPGMCWSPDSRRLALTAKSGARDAIILLDAESGDEEKLEFGLDGIFSVDWGGGAAADKLAFVGVDSGRSDIYVYDLATKELTNVTNDPFSDSDPAWSADGRSIFFCSDRRDSVNGEVPAGFRMQDFNYGENDIYRVDAATCTVERLTDFPGSSETSPAATPDGGHLLFISDMNGINNIYVRDLRTGEVRPITNSVSGVYQLSLSRNGEKLAFSSLHNAGFDIFLIRAPLDHRLDVAELEKTEYFRESRGLGIRTAAARPDTLPVAEGVVLKTTTEAVQKPETDAGINLRNFVFHRDDADSAGRAPDTVSFPAATNNIDADGSYRVNKYRLNFSPDIIYGSAGYNTLYGVEGSTVMAFSDMMGDHQIFLIMTLLLDLKNSDYAIAYLYLPKRIDYGIQAFHSARALYIYDAALGFQTLNRFRNYGVNLFAQYPVSRFRRVDFGLSGMVVRRENLDIPSVPADESTVIIPSLSFVDDNSLWGLIAPSTGRRYNISMLASPGIFDDAPAFWSITGDYRLYARLGPRYTLVLRFAGGGSFGPDPQKFIIGGVDGWINPRYARNQFPVETADDYLFLTTGVPLRGFNYNARQGSKYGAMNIELRFPLFAYLTAGPLPLFFQTLNGTLFFDAGTAWTRDQDLKITRRDPYNATTSSDLLSGTGFGVRAVVLGFLLKMDVAWAFNWQNFTTPIYYFSIGQDI
jgi:hypothetical protein